MHDTDIPAAAPTPLVHIVDDDPAIRDALAWLFLSRRVDARQWESGETFLAAWEPAMPGCILLDIRMAGMSGLEVFDQLLERGAVQPVVFLSGHGDLPLAVEMLKRGAVDFIEKPFNDNDLVDRVLIALDRGAERAQAQRRRADLEQRRASLSSREHEVMQQVLEGKLNKQIAEALGVTMRTVEVHRARVLEKMGVRNSVELARLLGPAD